MKVRRPMATTNETVADIIAEIRTINPYNEYADRIEAAHKRERKAGAEAAQICGEIGEMIG